MCTGIGPDSRRVLISRVAKDLSYLSRFSHIRETYMGSEVDPSCCEGRQYVAVSKTNWKTPGDKCHNWVAFGWCENLTCGKIRCVCFLKFRHKPEEDGSEKVTVVKLVVLLQIYTLTSHLTLASGSCVMMCLVNVWFVLNVFRHFGHSRFFLSFRSICIPWLLRLRMYMHLFTNECIFINN